MNINFVSQTIRTNINILQVLIFLSCVLLFTCSEFNFDSIKAIKIKQMADIERLLEETDMTYFAYYYKQTSENSKKGGEILVNIATKLEYLAVVLLIDCDQEGFENAEVCRLIPEAQDGFPRMEIYSPPPFKYNPYTKEMQRHSRHPYTKTEVGENLIYNFITSYIPARVTKVDPENFENFVSNLDLNKVMLFTDKDKTPLLMRGLSNYFYDKLLFGEVGKAETALLKKFKVKMFPTLIVYQTHEDDIPLEEPKIEVFDQPINAVNLVQFLERFALKERMSDRNKKHGNDPDKLKYKIAFKNLKSNEVLPYLNKFSERRFVILLDKNLEKDNLPEGLLKFNKITSGFFHFVRVNCLETKESEEFCSKTFRVSQYPKLLLLNISDDVKDINKRLERGGSELSFNFEELSNQIQNIFPSGVRDLNPQTFNSFLDEAGIKKKIPFIYLYDNDEIPLGLHLLSTEKKFQNFAEFVSFENPPKSLLQNFKITKLPKLVIVLQDRESPEQAKLMVYDEELVYFRLYSYINQYFNINRNSKVNKVDESVEEDVAFIEDKNKFDINCVGGRKLCVLAFLDGRIRPESKQQFLRNLDVFEHVNKASLKKSKPTSFAWVNATCQTEFSNQFNINSESVPNAVVYVPSKKLYANFVGTFEEDNLVAFIDKVLQGKVSFNKLDESKLIFNKTPCEEIKEEITLDSDEELMREIIEEEKKKREVFEKERQNLEDDGKSKKKKKKKKKSDL